MQAGFYFPFSAVIPTGLVSTAMFYCNMYPEEYYVEYAETYGVDQQTSFISPVFLAIAIVVCVLIVAVYIMCWYLSQKRFGWTIVALVLFSADTLYLISNGFSVDFLIDYAFHIWVMASLILGIVSHNKLKSLPDEPLLDIILKETDFENIPDDARSDETSETKDRNSEGGDDTSGK